eukprot:3551794-Pyramimonas_sp.AAC.1
MGPLLALKPLSQVSVGLGRLGALKRSTAARAGPLLGKVELHLEVGVVDDADLTLRNRDEVSRPRMVGHQRGGQPAPIAIN